MTSYPGSGPSEPKEPDRSEDSKTKFRQAFRLFGEAATEVLRQGIDRVDNKVRRPAATSVVTDEMRRVGAFVLRRHGLDAGLREPDGTPSSPQQVEVMLRDIATEVFNVMRDTAQGAAGADPHKPDTGPTQTANPRTGDQSTP